MFQVSESSLAALGVISAGLRLLWVCSVELEDEDDSENEPPDDDDCDDDDFDRDELGDDPEED